LIRPRQYNSRVYFSTGVGVVLMCAFLLRISAPDSISLSFAHTKAQTSHSPIKPRLIDPRSGDSGIHTQAFSALDTLRPVARITHEGEESQFFYSIGPYHTRPPPAF
jgi:hypothetical protein